MFCCSSYKFNFDINEAEIQAQIARNTSIEKQLEKDRMAQGNNLKILLLGGPESGKSTIFKQMRILHMNGFSELSLINYRNLVYSNLIQGIYQLISGANNLHIEVDVEVKADVRAIVTYFEQTLSSEFELNATLSAQIRRVFKAPFIRQVLLHRHEILLLDSAVYFLENLDRISENGYMPTHQDILRTRVSTIGICEIEFNYKQFMLKSGYCQMLDDGVQHINKLKYSMFLFRKIINNKMFGKQTAIIIFLNKVDIFKERLALFPLSVCYGAYSGSSDFGECINYVSDRFKSLLTTDEQKKQKIIYTHVTNATDTNNVEKVFESCIDVIFKQNLKMKGMAVE